MKKVKIFMAAALLVVAGAAAAFTSAKQVDELIYYFNPASSSIVPYQQQSLLCSPGSVGCKEVIPGVNSGQPVQLYVYRSDIGDFVTLQKD